LELGGTREVVFPQDEFMKIPDQFRKMDDSDVCCNNLQDDDGTMIDDVWQCPVCGKIWCGSHEDYLNRSLRTITPFGLKMLSALTDVVMEGKPLRLNIVLGRMAVKHPGIFEGMEN
jgi:hypothetical protein